MKFLIICLSLVLVVSLFMPTAFAQTENSLTVTTDRLYYFEGDIIKISGKGEPLLEVEKIIPGIPEPIGTEIKNPITIQIIGSVNNIVSIQQMPPDDDGTFSIQVTASGSLWDVPGLYTVRVQQGVDMSAETLFCFNHEKCVVPNPEIALTVVTDKSNYESGSSVLISITGTPSTTGSLIVIDPHDKPKLEDGIIFDSSGNAFLEIKLTNFIDGSHTVVVSSGNQQSATTFFVNNEPVPEPIPESEVIEEPKQKLPDWVRNIFIWYAEGQISEDELIGALQFLIQEGIIEV